MKFSDLKPSRYLKHADFANGPEILTIASATIEEVGQDKEPKSIIYFEGLAKGLVLNQTNGIMVAELAGDDEMDEWPGTVIEVYPTQTLFQGKKTPCLRVRAPRPVKPVLPRRPDLAPPDALSDEEEKELDDMTDDQIFGKKSMKR